MVEWGVGEWGSGLVRGGSRGVRGEKWGKERGVGLGER